MKLFLGEFRENYSIDALEAFVDGVPWLQGGLYEPGKYFRHETHGHRNPVKRINLEIKWQTNQFYNTLRHTNPDTPENWLERSHSRRVAFSEQDLMVNPKMI
jgi:hypothetical protein